MKTDPERGELQGEDWRLRERGLLASVMQATDVMLACFDAEFNFVWVNDAYARGCRRRPEDLIGRNHFALFPNEENEGIFRAVLDTGEPVFHKDKAFEYRDQPERGITYWDWSLAPVRDNGGRATGLVLSLRETTEHKRAEEALRMARERTDTILNSITDAFFALDREWRFTYLNPQGERQLRTTVAEALGRHISELFPGGDGFRRWCEQADATRQAVHFEEYYAPFKAWFQVHAYPSPDGLSVYLRDITEKRQADEAFRASQTRLRLAQVSAGAGVWDWDIPSGKLDWSEELFRLFGLDPRKSEATFDTWTTVLHPDDRAPAEKRIEAAIAAHATLISDYRIVLPSGEVRWINALGRTTYDDSGAPKRMSGICIDITERKAADEALRLSEERLRAFVQASAQAIWTADATGYSPEARAWMEKFTGTKSPAGANSDWVLASLHPDDRVLWENLKQTAVVTKAPLDIEMRVRRRDGVWRWVCLKSGSLREKDGTFREWVGTIADVTERKEAEDARRRNEAWLALLSRTPGRLLAADDPQAAVEDLCREVMEHLDCQAFFNFLPDANRGALHLNAWSGISEEDAARIEWLEYGAAVCGCVARDRARIIVENIQHTSDPRADLIRSYGIQAYCCHPLMTQGRLIGTLSFGTRTRRSFSRDDIEMMQGVAGQVAIAMDRIEAARALTASNARLLEMDRRKDNFLAVLSHELRNPLAPIRNSLYVMARAVPGGDHARQAQAIIERQVDQLARLVDDLLDVTRITRNKIQLQRQRLELNELVRHTLDDHLSEFERSGVHVALTPAPQPVFVYGDWNRLAQVLGNLLQNSAKFTGRGERTDVSVSVDRRAARAVLRVADTGAGMSPEVLGRLFQPFVQADTTLDRNKGGLGLGLALLKGLVDLHGGDVTAHSEGLGRGSEFIVRLPLDLTEPEKPVEPQIAGGSARRRVLIIEDNVDAAESLGLLLSLSGHDVSVTHSGSDGVANARDCRPEVLFCDIGLPGMDGYEVARAFRADDDLRDTLLVALSGYALPEDLQRAVEAGFDRHVAKPLSIDKLGEIMAHLESRSLSRSPDGSVED
jgi:PAS domain S-box-containing protein